MGVPDETIDDDEELSFAPAPSPDQSPEEARARLAALRGKPLDAPSRLAVVSEEEPVDATVNREPEAAPAASAPSGATINLALPANMAARLLALLGDEKPTEAPKAEPQRPAKAQKGEKPLFKAVKVRITTRVDADVLDAFKATGPGWQSRMNDVLRENMPNS